MIRIEYQYRDADNYKAWGNIYCSGSLQDDPEAVERLNDLIEREDPYDIDRGPDWMEHPGTELPGFSREGLHGYYGAADHSLMEWVVVEDVATLEGSSVGPITMDRRPQTLRQVMEDLGILDEEGTLV